MEPNQQTGRDAAQSRRCFLIIGITVDHCRQQSMDGRHLLSRLLSVGLAFEQRLRAPPGKSLFKVLQPLRARRLGVKMSFGQEGGTRRHQVFRGVVGRWRWGPMVVLLSRWVLSPLRAWGHGLGAMVMWSSVVLASVLGGWIRRMGTAPSCVFLRFLRPSSCD